MNYNTPNIIKFKDLLSTNKFNPYISYLKICQYHYDEISQLIFSLRKFMCLQFDLHVYALFVFISCTDV